MRTVGVVTVARSDYGNYLPVLRQIQAEPALQLRLIVSGMHLSPEFGLTVRAIEDDGFPIAERVEMLLSSDTPEGITKSMGLGAMGFAQAFGRQQPDLLLVYGDRFEMHAAALAALPFKIPVAHIHGGEVTEGAIDDALRHCITKLSHLHFVSTEEYARRVMQLGEEPWRVTVSGAPAMDNLRTVKIMDRQEMKDRFGIQLDSPPLLVTFHPVTLEYDQTERQVRELLAALRESRMPVVFTAPNADTGGRAISRLLEEFVEAQPQAQMCENLGTQGFFSLMASSAAMVGNSSSGMIEAAQFGLPVVNIGNRQKGRMRSANIIDVGYRREEVSEGIRRALAPEFRDGMKNLPSPYGDGHASERIIEVLKNVSLDDSLLIKKFFDLPVQASKAAPAQSLQPVAVASPGKG